MKLTWKAVALGGAAALVIGAGVLAMNSNHESVRAFEAARRIDGDIVVVSYGSSFPNPEYVRNLASRYETVRQARIFSISEVEVESRLARASGFLKLAPFDATLARRLDLSPSSVPSPRREGSPAELTIGESLASRLRVNAGDGLKVSVSHGTVRAEVLCRIRAVVSWGHAHFDELLLYGDISLAVDFKLAPVGVEVSLVNPDLRGAVARRLESDLSAPYKTLSLEQLLAARQSHE